MSQGHAVLIAPYRALVSAVAPVMVVLVRRFEGVVGDRPLRSLSLPLCLY